MDQVKIGKFIQTLRKERKLTQSDIAKKLNISDKTVSKWETGNGLPDVSLMLPLCEILSISVNELLSGEKLDEKQYHSRAEENIMSLMTEKKRARRNIAVAIITIVISLIACIAIAFIVENFEMELWAEILIMAGAVAVLIAGALVACVIDNDVGKFVCPHCGEKFVPTLTSYVFGYHGITWRRLKCPNCGKKGICKKIYYE